MFKGKYKALNLLFFLIAFSCSHNIKWDYELLSFWSQGELKTYAFLNSKVGWVACDVNAMGDKTIREQKSYLKSISRRNLTESEESFCALYRCSEDSNDECINEGSYLVFSEVIQDVIQEIQSQKYVSSRTNSIYAWEAHEKLCLKEADLNSCAISVNHHRYITKNRKLFYRIRARECELLSISENDCNFDF